MATTRRDFLKMAGAAGALGAAGARPADASPGAGASHEWWGMLTDLSVCIGCRKCEYACKAANGLPNEPLESYEDPSVFRQKRRPDANNLTVVNRYPGGEADAPPVYVKKQCLHCNHPACASVCPVAAIRKSEQGPVIYEASLCMGCRYCMMACPFNIPAYTYDIPLTPVVRKCTMCFEKVSKEGGVPACAKICPVEAITFNRRGKLLALAREKIRSRPDVYVDHVYGEHEVGGTGWLYVAPISFDQLGFRTDLGARPAPEWTEGFLSIIPLVVSIWPAALAGLYALTKPRGPSAAGEPNSQTPTAAKGA
jgi:formate dehydrogenase iron-sulfur subunit